VVRRRAMALERKQRMKMNTTSVPKKQVFLAILGQINNKVK